MTDATKVKDDWNDSSDDEVTHSSSGTNTSPAHANTADSKTLKDSNETIDSIEPVSEGDFEVFACLLNKKISSFHTSPLYAELLTTLIKDICSHMEADDVKKISHDLSALSVEKAKLNSKNKGKKSKKKKPALLAGKKKHDFEAYEDEDNYDFDDM